MQSDSYPDTIKKHRSVRWLSVLEAQLSSFSPGERFALYAFTALLCVSSFALLSAANTQASVTVPSDGGSFTEGVVGPARFLNPLLTLSQPDEDISALVYSGLMRALPSGELVPDLASSYTVSEDGTEYTFTLRQGLRFHDGEPLTADDVVFTVQRAKSPEIRSFRRADWEGVSVSSPDQHTVVFKLPHAYAPFLENTTLGILPKHLWGSVSADEFPFSPLNTHPVGSGPYEVANVKANATGAIERFELSAFKGFALGAAYIKTITFVFFPNEGALLEAFNKGAVDNIASISPARVADISRKNAQLVRVVLPRTFGIFFNQAKNPVLADASVRRALDAAIDKEALIATVLSGYGVPANGPIPPELLTRSVERVPQTLPTAATAEPAAENADVTRGILQKGGWKFDEETGTWKKKDATLSLSLSTADTPELAATADMVARMWRAAGIQVDVHVYTLSELNTNILRPRAYEAILFGQVVGRALDLFAFWHSSQRNDPGLNLSLYTNSKVDALLSSARATADAKERVRLYRQFEEIIAEEEPAVFLYAPEFLYALSGTVQGITLGVIGSPGERFLGAYEWYTDTERVWNIFTHLSEYTL